MKQLTAEEKLAAAQDILFEAIKTSLNAHGVEATLEAIANQFGVTGAAAVIMGVINPPDFAGKYVMRSLAVCDRESKDRHIQGVM